MGLPDKLIDSLEGLIHHPSLVVVSLMEFLCELSPDGGGVSGGVLVVASCV